VRYRTAFATILSVTPGARAIRERLRPRLRRCHASLAICWIGWAARDIQQNGIEGDFPSWSINSNALQQISLGVVAELSSP